MGPTIMISPRVPSVTRTPPSSTTRTLVLLIFAAVIEKRSAIFDHVGKDPAHRLSSQNWVVVEVADELPAEGPHIVDVLLNRFR